MTNMLAKKIFSFPTQSLKWLNVIGKVSLKIERVGIFLVGNSGVRK